MDLSVCNLFLIIVFGVIRKLPVFCYSFEPIVVFAFVEMDGFMSICQDISYVDINVDKRHVDNRLISNTLLLSLTLGDTSYNKHIVIQ